MKSNKHTYPQASIILLLLITTVSATHVNNTQTELETLINNLMQNASPLDPAINPADLSLCKAPAPVRTDITLNDYTDEIDGLNEETLIWQSAGEKTLHLRIPKNADVKNSAMKLSYKGLTGDAELSVESHSSKCCTTHSCAGGGVRCRDEDTEGFTAGEGIYKYIIKSGCVSRHGEYRINGIDACDKSIELIAETLTLKTSCSNWGSCCGSPNGCVSCMIRATSKVAYEKIPATDLSLDVGGDRSREWSRPGEFIGTETINNLSEELNKHLETCTPEPDGFCSIPLTLYSNTPGQLRIDWVHVDYRLTRQPRHETVSLSASKKASCCGNAKYRTRGHATAIPRVSRYLLPGSTSDFHINTHISTTCRSGKKARVTCYRVNGSSESVDAWNKNIVLRDCEYIQIYAEARGETSASPGKCASVRCSISGEAEIYYSTARDYIRLGCIPHETQKAVREDNQNIINPPSGFGKANDGNKKTKATLSKGLSLVTESSLTDLPAGNRLIKNISVGVCVGATSGGRGRPSLYIYDFGSGEYRRIIKYISRDSTVYYTLSGLNLNRYVDGNSIRLKVYARRDTEIKETIIKEVDYVSGTSEDPCDDHNPATRDKCTSNVCLHKYSYSDWFRSDATLIAGYKASATASVYNTGQSEASFIVTLLLDGLPQAHRVIHLGGGEGTGVSFNFTPPGGTHNLSVKANHVLGGAAYELFRDNNRVCREVTVEGSRKEAKSRQTPSGSEVLTSQAGQRLIKVGCTEDLQCQDTLPSTTDECIGNQCRHTCEGNCFPEIQDPVNSYVINPTNLASGDTVSVEAAVFNNGGLDANNFLVVFEDDGDIVDYRLLSLENGESRDVGFTWTASPGGHRLSIKADPLPEPYGVITEVCESNNEVSAEIEVSDPAAGEVFLDPAASWSLDEDGGDVAHDLSGNNNHGTLYGAEWAPGVSGNALMFDGGSYVEIPNSSSMSLRDVFTFEAWINPDETPQDSVIFSRGRRDDAVTMGLDPFLRPHLIIRNNGLSKNIQSTTPLPPGKWSYVVASFDNSSNVWRLYIDGVLNQELMSPWTLPDTGDGDAFIGSDGLDTYFKGRLDEVRLYGVLLDPEQVLNISRGYTILLSYPFPEGVGNKTTDFSINRNDGFIQGADWVYGVRDYALSFDGAGDYLRVEDHPSLDVVNEFSAEAWIKASSLPTGKHRIVDRFSNRKGFYLQTMGGRVYFGVGNGSSERTSGGYRVETDRWYHLIGTYNPTADGDNLKLYVDGELVKEAAVKGFVSDVGKPLAIGSGNEFRSQFFHGIIDGVRLYSRVLSAGEVLMRYGSYARITCPEGGVRVGETDYCCGDFDGLCPTDFSVFCEDPDCGLGGCPGGGVLLEGVNYCCGDSDGVCPQDFDVVCWDPDCAVHYQSNGSSHIPVDPFSGSAEGAESRGGSGLIPPMPPLPISPGDMVFLTALAAALYASTFSSTEGLKQALSRVMGLSRGLDIQHMSVDPIVVDGADVNYVNLDGVKTEEIVIRNAEQLQFIDLNNVEADRIILENVNVLGDINLRNARVGEVVVRNVKLGGCLDFSRVLGEGEVLNSVVLDNVESRGSVSIRLDARESSVGDVVLKNIRSRDSVSASLDIRDYADLSDFVLEDVVARNDITATVDGKYYGHVGDVSYRNLAAGGNIHLRAYADRKSMGDVVLRDISAALKASVKVGAYSEGEVKSLSLNNIYAAQHLSLRVRADEEAKIRRVSGDNVVSGEDLYLNLTAKNDADIDGGSLRVYAAESISGKVYQLKGGEVDVGVEKSARRGRLSYKTRDNRDPGDLEDQGINRPQESWMGVPVQYLSDEAKFRYYFGDLIGGLSRETLSNGNTVISGRSRAGNDIGERVLVVDGDGRVVYTDTLGYVSSGGASSPAAVEEAGVVDVDLGGGEAVNPPVYIKNGYLYVLMPNGSHMMFTYDGVLQNRLSGGAAESVDPTLMSPREVFDLLYGVDGVYNPWAALVGRGLVDGGGSPRFAGGGAGAVGGSTPGYGWGNVLGAVNPLLGLTAPAAGFIEGFRDLARGVYNNTVGWVWGEVTAPRDFLTHVPLLNDAVRAVEGNSVGRPVLDFLLGVTVDEEKRIWTSLGDLGIDLLYAADGVGAIARVLTWMGKAGKSLSKITKLEDVFKLTRKSDIYPKLGSVIKPATENVKYLGSKTYDFLKGVAKFREMKYFKNRFKEIFDSTTVEGFLTGLGKTTKPFDRIFNPDTRLGRVSIPGLSSYCNLRVGDPVSGLLYGVKTVFGAAPAAVGRRMAGIMSSVGTLLEVGTWRSFIDGNTDALQSAKEIINQATSWHNQFFGWVKAQIDGANTWIEGAKNRLLAGVNNTLSDLFGW